MTDRTRKLPPPPRRDRDVGGFSAKPGDLQPEDDSDVVDLRGNATGEAEGPANEVEYAAQQQGSKKPRASRKVKAKAKSSQADRGKELRRRLIATVTPPTRELLEQRARESRSSFADVLIEAWLNHADGLAKEYKPDALTTKREQLGVRKPRHKRPRGRTDVQFYLTERET